MDGNFSGFIDLINLMSWAGISLVVNSGWRAMNLGKLKLNLDGMLTNDLNPDSSEYRNMYLLKRTGWI